MVFIKYMGMVVVDSKNLFNVKSGIKSLGDIFIVEYDNFKFGFCGFKEFGKSMGGIPLLVSIDRNNLIAYVFEKTHNDFPKGKLCSYICDTLVENDYSLVSIRENLESGKCL